MPDLTPNYRENDVLSYRTVNELIRRAISEPITLKVGPGLFGRLSGNHMSIGLAQTPIRAAKGKVDGGISARTSDSSHGTGDVVIWAKDPSTGDYAATDETVTVDYISSTAGGVPNGTWVNIIQFADSHYEVVSVDCGN